MTSPILTFAATGLYLAAGGLQWRKLLGGQPPGQARLPVHAAATLAWLLHAFVLYDSLQLQTGLNFALTGAVSLVAWTVVALFLLAAIRKPVDNLAALLLPLAAVTLLVEWGWPGEVLLDPGSRLQAVHIVISILAYSLVSLAALQSLLLLYQERALHHRHPGGLLRALPPLQTMETLMFQMLGIGFVLLTLTVASGAFFSEQLFGRPLRLSHHVVLSLLAWAVFAVLLAGRHYYGWRGRIAVRWTLAGFVLLLLGYFGSKFVLEVLLRRGG